MSMWSMSATCSISGALAGHLGHGSQPAVLYFVPPLPRSIQSNCLKQSRDARDAMKPPATKTTDAPTSCQDSSRR